MNFVSYKFNTEEGSHTVGLWEENNDGEISDVLYEKDYARFIEENCTEDRFWECVNELAQEALNAINQDENAYCLYLCIDNSFYKLPHGSKARIVKDDPNIALTCEIKNDYDTIKFNVVAFWDRSYNILSQQDFLDIEKFIEDTFGDYNEKSVNLWKNRVFYEIMHSFFKEGWNSNDSKSWYLNDKNLWKAFELLDNFCNFDFIEEAFLTIGDKVFRYAI